MGLPVYLTLYSLLFALCFEYIRRRGIVKRFTQISLKGRSLAFERPFAIERQPRAPSPAAESRRAHGLRRLSAGLTRPAGERKRRARGLHRSSASFARLAGGRRARGLRRSSASLARLAGGRKRRAHGLRRSSASLARLAGGRKRRAHGLRRSSASQARLAGGHGVGRRAHGSRRSSVGLHAPRRRPWRRASGSWPEPIERRPRCVPPAAQ